MEFTQNSDLKRLIESKAKNFKKFPDVSNTSRNSSENLFRKTDFNDYKKESFVNGIKEKGGNSLDLKILKENISEKEQIIESLTKKTVSLQQKNQLLTKKQEELTKINQSFSIQVENLSKTLKLAQNENEKLTNEKESILDYLEEIKSEIDNKNSNSNEKQQIEVFKNECKKFYESKVYF